MQCRPGLLSTAYIAHKSINPPNCKVQYWLPQATKGRSPPVTAVPTLPAQYLYHYYVDTSLPLSHCGHTAVRSCPLESRWRPVFPPPGPLPQATGCMHASCCMLHDYRVFSFSEVHQQTKRKGMLIFLCLLPNRYMKLELVSE